MFKILSLCRASEANNLTPIHAHITFSGGTRRSGRCGKPTRRYHGTSCARTGRRTATITLAQIPAQTAIYTQTMYHAVSTINHGRVGSPSCILWCRYCCALLLLLESGDALRIRQLTSAILYERMSVSTTHLSPLLFPACHFSCLLFLCHADSTCRHCLLRRCTFPGVAL